MIGPTLAGEPSSSPGSVTRAMYMPPPAGGAPNRLAADCCGVRCCEFDNQEISPLIYHVEKLESLLF